MAREKTVFVVSRLNWRPVIGGSVVAGSWWRAPGTARLASFAARDEAEVERARREANARGRVNPFRCGTPFAELTTLPENIFLDWVSDTGLSPPKAKKGAPRDWASWWDATRPEMSAEQLAKLWEGLNKLPFFRVDERPDVPVGYAVTSPVWLDNGETTFVYGEGGRVEAVYRSRERAEAEARKGAYAQGQDNEWHPNGADLFDPETYWRMAMAGGPLDLVEIELHDVRAGARKGYLVARYAWCGTPGDLCRSSTARVPVRGFGSGKDAEAHRRELEAEFRREYDAWPYFCAQWMSEAFEGIKAVAVRVGLVAGDAELMRWWWTLPAPPTPEQRAALWAVVPDKAYDVIETQLVK
jgi:hypothetical protein